MTYESGPLPSISYDADEHVKEVFAHFGLAYYLSGVFETGLANALLQLDFLTKQKSEIERAAKAQFSRAKFEADFDTFLAAQHAKTLGNLVKRLHELTNPNDTLKALVSNVKVKRDFLAHHFFRERAEDFGRRAGRDKMLAELKEAQELFEAADHRFEDYMKPVVEALGMPTQKIERYVRDYIRAVQSEDE